ncbi:alpha/beta fold hydrolase [Streptosporangium sp. NBC_01755]|uniref:alpha/beta fold hydrolase n=1 Tax=unclassified Streptosporangium TaxID=2632669 RepID=UPI002DD7B274|nr:MULTISPECIES: alpha/beta fold hydrolase [unclassified Streptosporangium]WSA24628.1 alpha/beta fold hydrolase [Streptosporangium sp. NBC_01810]WSC97296.1 alpha/beta fold hydrolase [Streptosporangium sp. NBC_01755]
MGPQGLVFDVTDAVGTGERLTQTAWLFTPAGAPKAALLCLAGGTYDKRYWHLEVPGHPGYSFAEHLAANGYLVVALDHLGVGGSSDPRHSGERGVRLLARGDAAVAAQLGERLRDGTLASGLPAQELPLVGVGHSLGACLTAVVQAEARPFDAVVLLGYGVQFVSAYDKDNSADDLAERVARSEAIFRQVNGTAPDATSCVVPRSGLHPIFHAPGVPEEVVAADDAAESRVSVRAVSEAITPGFAAKYVPEIKVPVFLGFGAVRDNSPDPHAEPGNYPASRDVTLYVVTRSGHCHNLADDRATLWDRIAAWIPAAVAMSGDAIVG